MGICHRPDTLICKLECLAQESVVLRSGRKLKIDYTFRVQGKIDLETLATSDYFLAFDEQLQL